MTIKTVKHSDSMEGFQSNGLKRWRGFEVMAELGENESPDEAKDKLVALVQNWHKFDTPELANYQPEAHVEIPIVQVQKDSKEEATQRMINEINACANKKTLETYRLIAKSSPELQQAFDNKLKQLQ